jgi:hypothetical protein
MHPVYRQLIFAFLSLISLMITCNKCERQKARQQWGPELDEQMHEVFYMQSEKFTTDEGEKQQYADCCLSKMKELFPRGIGNIDKQMNDSTKIAIMKMGVECSKSFVNHKNIWQPEVIQQLKLQFYSYPETKLLPAAAKQEYADCISFKVVSGFPNGFDGNSNKDTLKQVIQKARKDCLVLVLNKYKKLKRAKGKYE